MSAVRFMPWVGSRYATEGFEGLRVLIVCDSHYGMKRYERPTVTQEIVLALGQRKRHPDAVKALARHPHFAKIATSMHNATRAGDVGRAQLKAFWDHVSYYNFVQEFMPKSRRRPSDEAWNAGVAAFPTVVEALNPEVIIAFGHEMSTHLRRVGVTIPTAHVRHPSAGYSYAKWNPLVQTALSEARDRRAVSPGPMPDIDPLGPYGTWYQSSRDALPAHGLHLPPEKKAAAIAAWGASFPTLEP